MPHKQTETELARQAVKEDQHPHRRRPVEEATFHEYSAGSDALPWKGWYEDADGEVTAWVDLADRVHIRIDTNVAPQCVLAERNAAWNAVRDAVRAAADLPSDPEKMDYWPQSTVSCLMSLALKELHRTPKGESQSGAGWDAKDRRRRTIRTLEDVLATSETFLPKKRGALDRSSNTAPGS